MATAAEVGHRLVSVWPVDGPAHDRWNARYAGRVLEGKLSDPNAGGQLRCFQCGARQGIKPGEAFLPSGIWTRLVSGYQQPPIVGGTYVTEQKLMGLDSDKDYQPENWSRDTFVSPGDDDALMAYLRRRGRL
jgi:hypothetical protein